MPGSFDFIHVKRHTRGSSNEISFDVLDAARDELDSRNTKSSKAAKPISASKGTYHGVAGTSTLSAIPEVEKRKRQRHNRAVRFRVLVVLIAVAAIVALGFLAYNLQRGKADFSSRYDALVSSVEQTDEQVKIVDGLMSDPFNDDETEKRAKALAEIDAVEKSLDDVAGDIDKTAAYCSDDEDTFALNQLSDTVEGRKQMISTARKAFMLSEEHQQALNESRNAWTMVVNADQQAREATAAANKATTDVSTSAARQLTQEASDMFAQARTTLDNLQKKRQGLVFADEIAYIDMRIEALSYAMATSDALIEGDRDEAVAHNTNYNKLDQEAANKALSLPLMLDERVNEAYSEEKSQLVDEYSEKRASVVALDAGIRAYLKN